MITHPSAQQWHLFAQYQHCPPPLHPALFLQDWSVSYGELAQLAGVSRSTVEHWFSLGSSHREPALLHCRRLAVIHRLWHHSDRITPELIGLWCNGNN